MKCLGLEVRLIIGFFWIEKFLEDVNLFLIMIVFDYRVKKLFRGSMWLFCGERLR